MRLLEIHCEICGELFRAKRRDARYCSARCRKRAQNGIRLFAGSGGIAAAVADTLTRRGASASPLGVMARLLAEALDQAQPAQSAAALSRELRATLATLEAEPAATADPVDELRWRRDAKRGRS